MGGLLEELPGERLSLAKGTLAPHFPRRETMWRES
jgi:hypothetical protein